MLEISQFIHSTELLVSRSAYVCFVEILYTDTSTDGCTDRDPKRWNLPEKIIQKRRNLFWEMCVQEVAHVRYLVPHCFSC